MSSAQNQSETPRERFPRRQPILRSMKTRDPEERHRAATPLELLYDLCFVVAIAQAASSFHHAISAGHGAEGLIGFCWAFFSIWWAWVSFAWFASAFDNDDAIYRIKVFIQMIGVLVLAAGIPRVFEHQDFALLTVGWTIMRVGLIAQWLRAAIANPSQRKTAFRYVFAILILQAGWLSLLLLPPEQWMWGGIPLTMLELLAPGWAERAGKSSWHPEHLAERYGLFTIIVIGESVLAATLAIQSAIDLNQVSAQLFTVILGAPTILFAMWWLYFSRPAHAILTSNPAAFLWGYGHSLILGSAAAVGVGLAVLSDYEIGEAQMTSFGAGQTVAIPVALFIASTWAFHLRRPGPRAKVEALQVMLACACILAAPLTPIPVVGIALALILITVAMSRQSTPQAEA
ncbi:MAG: low temperature requirement protein A [Planctomycetota bacterium]|nr:MAG: low temperature requirement protein A [Planctomycetota bacterium]